MRFPAYPKCKPSGVEWLGDLPQHWDLKRLKHVLTRNEGGTWGDEDSDGCLVLRSTEQTLEGGWTILEPARCAIPELEKRKYLLRGGDLVVTKSSGSALHIGKTSLVTKEVAELSACFSNFMQRLRFSDVVDPRIGFYLLNAPIGRQQVVFRSNTTTGLANLNASVLGNVYFGLPPKNEQVAIADFLDAQTAKVGVLVAKKWKLIEKLKEKRIALISRTVTRGLPPKAAYIAGLDPHPNLKPTGIEWIGEVPEHWEIKPLMRVTEDKRPIMYGIVLPGPNVDEGVPIVKGGDVKPGRLNLKSLCRTTFEIEARYERSRLRCDDIVFSIRGSVGEAELVPAEIEGANLTQDAARIAPMETVDPKWLLYAVKARPIVDPVLSLSLGAAVRGVNIRDLKRVKLPVPPQGEQRVIASFLDCETGKIDQMISKVESAIELLQEYRSALIAAAVTGKIDVRETPQRLEEAPKLTPEGTAAI